MESNIEKRDKLMEGHRLIREFKREEKKCEEITTFELKELGDVKNLLSKKMDDLRSEMEKNKGLFEKQQDIASDMGTIKHYIDNIENIERGLKDISKKYCLNK